LTHAVDRHVRQVLSLLDLTGNLAVEGPVAQLGVAEIGPVRPLERVGPDLVARAGEEEDGRQKTVSGAAQGCRATREGR
jgi:hypothetical protein